MLSAHAISNIITNADLQQKLDREALRQAHENYKAALIGTIERLTRDAIISDKPQFTLDYDKIYFDARGFSVNQVLFGNWVRKSAGPHDSSNSSSDGSKQSKPLDRAQIRDQSSSSTNGSAETAKSHLPSISYKMALINGCTKEAPKTTCSSNSVDSKSNNHRGGYFDRSLNREAGLDKTPLYEVRLIARPLGYRIRDVSDSTKSRRKIIMVTFVNDWKVVKAKGKE